MNPFTDLKLWQQGAFFSLAALARYVVIAGGAYLFVYIILRNRTVHARIQKAFPTRDKIRMEILYSLSTFLIFGGLAIFTGWMNRNGWTMIYRHLHDYPMWWFWLSIPVMLIVHDTWFYWWHRFMHLKRIFPVMHKVHHLSTNPTPWTSFSFHPTEAVIEGGILPFMVMIMPLHPLAILIFLVVMTVENVIGHLGYEFFPSGFTKNFIFKFSNTSTHHNMHHRLVKCNYGLYLNIWDRIMKTNHEHYHESFEEVVAQRKNKN